MSERTPTEDYIFFLEKRLERRVPPKRLNARVAGYLGIETKFIDYTFSGTVPTTNTGAEADPPGIGAQTTPGSISAIAQGESESNRDGRKATLIHLDLGGDITTPASAALSGSTKVRVAVVWDTQTNGAQLNSEDVFLPATNVEHAKRNLQFAKRFKILKDVLITMNPTNSAGNGTANDTGPFTKSFHWKIKLPNIQVIHNGNTAVVASITDNSIHVISFASNGSPVLNYESRIMFRG